MNFTKPILAASLLEPHTEHTDHNILEAMKKLRVWPVLATLKKDGIRALRLNASLLSRTLKLIPNKSIRDRSMILPAGMDMELWCKELDYCQVESIVMSQEHTFSDKIEFHILDWFGQGESYGQRVGAMINLMSSPKDEPESYHRQVKFSPPLRCDNADQLFAFFKLCELELGEGICFRTPMSPYKHGRSTLKEQYLIKLARYENNEAVITGFLEQLENINYAKRNAVGNIDRSSSVDGMVGKNTLGAFMCKDVKSGLEFTIGTGIGLTNELRQKIWDDRDCYVGKVISYRSKGHGTKVKPRSPTFRGFRSEIDI